MACPAMAVSAACQWHYGSDCRRRTEIPEPRTCSSCMTSADSALEPPAAGVLLLSHCCHTVEGLQALAACQPASAAAALQQMLS